MTDVIEYGKCEVCGKEAALKRTYFRYGFKCQCHSPNHFEFVRHCVDCVPQKPLETKVVFSDEQANNLVSVKRGHWAGKHNGFQVCSECREWTNAVFKYEYCPWCGAKMVGDE